MTDFNNAIQSVIDRVQASAATASPNDLVYLAKAIEAAGPASAVSFLVQLAEAEKAQITGLTTQKMSDITTAAAAKIAEINATLPILLGTSNPTATTNATILGQEFINTTTGELFICVNKTTNANRWIGYFGTSVNMPQGQQLFDTVGASQSFVVPAGVTSISTVLVGGGGGGSTGWDNGSGGGGALAYASVPVTPGETLLITVGAGGSQGSNGSDTAIYRGATLLFKAEGGKYNASIRATPVAGTITPKGGRGGYRLIQGREAIDTAVAVALLVILVKVAMVLTGGQARGLDIATTAAMDTAAVALVVLDTLHRHTDLAAVAVLA